MIINFSLILSSVFLILNLLAIENHGLNSGTRFKSFPFTAQIRDEQGKKIAIKLTAVNTYVYLRKANLKFDNCFVLKGKPTQKQLQIMESSVYYNLIFLKSMFNFGAIISNKDKSISVNAIERQVETMKKIRSTINEIKLDSSYNQTNWKQDYLRRYNKSIKYANFLLEYITSKRTLKDRKILAKQLTQLTEMDDKISRTINNKFINSKGKDYNVKEYLIEMDINIYKNEWKQSSNFDDIESQILERNGLKEQSYYLLYEFMNSP